MKPPEFGYHRPASLPDALALLGAHAGAKPLAGGQSLIPAMNFRLAAPAALVDLNQLTELSGITESADGGLAIGAMTRHSAVERSPLVRARAPLLSLAMPFIAHSQIRSRGTLGGSLAHADPAAELPAVMVALDAGLTLESTRGSRTIPAGEFFTGLFATALESGELITRVEIPPPLPGSGAAFLELARRHGDYALVGVAVVVTRDAGRVGGVRIVLFSVGEGPVRAGAAERALTGSAGDSAAIRAAAEAIQQDIDPPSDIHASAAYRRQLATVLTGRALAAALERAGESNP
ncbi:MAG TPA: xanthine dehydrogenase family protein subunit M [Gemmatimonadales bacterium]|nr:xanthine dehydrogenase family protein subunit M [Gemmatimonadales bacterium]